MEKLQLVKPVMMNGETVIEIEYDLDALTGEDIDAAVRDLKKTGVLVGSVETDPNYHMALFAQAAGVSYEDVKRMSAKDTNKAIIAVRDFFL